MINTLLFTANVHNILLLCTGSLILVSLLIFSIVFLNEKEIRAARLALLSSILFALPFMLIALTEFNAKKFIAYLLVGITWLFLVSLVFPERKFRKIKPEKPTRKHDERDIMFSRNELKKGTEKFEQYYAKNPDIKELDDEFRKRPGLLSPESVFFDPYSYASANANLEVIEALKPRVNGEINKTKTQVDHAKIGTYLKEWAKQLGVHSIGIARLEDYHLYSHKGRGDLYGKEINNMHSFAIALTVEMDIDMIQAAPRGPAIMESTQQYLRSGTIALQIASFIRNLGYSARAHIDGNYELICPLVARDAGLGEIGRMGLLMTPKLGPRVRIAVITTEMPLIPDNISDYSSVIDFCTICKKCAEVCPSQAIPTGEREQIGNTLQWKINSESCFTYWCMAGTDCGRCIAVCPYAHPNNVAHNLIRWGIKNSRWFQQFAIAMDDFFFGKKPKSRKIPSWIDI